jgi:hypothetical protein
MAQRIRGQEVTVMLVVDGNQQVGSFAKTERFKWNPMADLESSDFVGESTSEPDVQHHGYEFSFTVHQMEGNALAVWQNIANQLAAGGVLPNVSLVAVKKFRDPSLVPETVVFQRVALKLDDEDVGGRKDYVKNGFSGRCRSIQVF